jgi:hypothetical protein
MTEINSFSSCEFASQPICAVSDFRAECDKGKDRFSGKEAQIV